jgi:hypothetical protein
MEKQKTKQGETAKRIGKGNQKGIRKIKRNTIYNLFNLFFLIKPTRPVER